MKALTRALLVISTFTPALAIDVVLDNHDSVKQAASTVAYGLMKYYTGNNTGDNPGNLPDPYYWWEAGAMFGTMIDYWFITGDTSYNEVTSQAVVHQASETRDFMPKNQTRTEGNDDQGFWVLAAMSAAENKFPDPPADKPQWLSLSQAVFNQFARRWETADCGGGLRWQIFQFNSGYNYKNSVSNGCFFNLASRLARYTGNSSYADWADKIWDWGANVGLIGKEFQIFDGVNIPGNGQLCDNVNTNEWSYNLGLFIHGAAVMYNLTSNDVWKQRLDGLLKHAQNHFLKDGIIYEPHCELHGICDLNPRSFKGYFLRWLAGAMKMAPHIRDISYPVIRTAAERAAASCTGSPGPPAFKGHPGTACGFTWIEKGKFDSSVGVGEQMNALDALMYSMMDVVEPPFTEKTGGTSKGDPSAAGSANDMDHLPSEKAITAGDKAGAAILTLILVGGLVGGTTVLLWD